MGNEEGFYVDNDETAWVRYTPNGESYAEYVRPVAERYAQLHAERGAGNYDRNDIYREDFNTRVRSGGGLNANGVLDFYADPNGLFAKNRAYEIEGPNCFSNVLRNGLAHLEGTSEYLHVIDVIRDRIPKNRRPVMIDHGCGSGFTALAFAKKGFVSILFDFPIPSLRLVADLAEKNFNNRTVLHSPDRNGGIPIELQGVKVDLVVTQDVLEHCVNPVDVLAQLAGMVHPGGLLLMGTFFNSCNGHDPSHLDEHAGFQDVPKWFAEVENVGFYPFFADKNGVMKVWQKR